MLTKRLNCALAPGLGKERSPKYPVLAGPYFESGESRKIFPLALHPDFEGNFANAPGPIRSGLA